MKKSNECAFPFRSVSNMDTGENNYGLTKLEYASIVAMQGLCTSGLRNPENVAKQSIEIAKELLKQLDNDLP